MATINMKRVLLGGLVGGVVFIVVELVLEGIVAFLGVNERDLLLEQSSNLTLSGARFHIVNLLQFFVLFILVMWVYAAVRPRFGPGPKTALITSFIFWFTMLLFGVNFINMNVFPIKLTIISLLFNVVEFPAGVLAGASLYKEE
jgi:hypothetical protein